MSFKTLISAAVISGTFALMSPVHAQTADQSAPAQAPADNQNRLEVTDELALAFLTAANAVNDVRLEWLPKIEAAETDEQADALAAQAQEEMTTTVQLTPGITVQQYVVIAQAAQNNPQLAQMLQGIMAQQNSTDG